MAVRWLDFETDTGRLRLDDLPGLLSARTRLVAVGGASDALGTVNDVAAVVAAVRATCDALVFVDAVQLVPHLPVDVRALGCHLLACSPYKLFGPHLGVLWMRSDLAGRTEAYKVARRTPRARTASRPGRPRSRRWRDSPPPSTISPSLGGKGASRRARIVAGRGAASAYEGALGERLLAGLARLASVRLYGPPTMEGRVPTFAFTVAGHAPDAVARHLAERGVHV